MTPHDFTAEAAEYAKRIPDPWPARMNSGNTQEGNNVIRFPTRSERWSRTWTRPMPEPAPPGGEAA